MDALNAVGQLLADPLTYPFLRRAFAAALAAAVVCAVLSCWLVLTGWSLLGDAVSHAVLPGVVLSYILGLPFALGATVFGLLAVWLIGGLRRTSRVKEDASIGIVFTTLFALGLVLVSVTPSQVDLHHIVFGNLLGVSRTDLVQVLVLAAACLTVLLIRRRDLTLWAFDPRHARVVGLNPRVLAGILLGCLALTCVVAMQTVGVVLVVAMSKERLELEQRTKAQTDPLTGALNRRAFMARGERLISRHSHEDATLSLLFLDLDHFKALNDRFGHSGGDDVLTCFVGLVNSCIRPTDFLFRMGGEEFCCLLPYTGTEQAMRVAERIRQQVEAASVIVAGMPAKATVSIGIASTDEFGYDLDVLIRQADGAVYAAKRAGRNRVEVSSGPTLSDFAARMASGGGGALAAG